MKNVCVFCGSSPGANSIYQDSAKNLGLELVKNNIDLVYGGGNMGLMGIVSQAVLNSGGRSIGVIPKAIADKVDHHEISELHIVKNMHERKQKMFDLSDAFIALPGGFGTLEEILEIITWAQLGFHQKPIGLMNIEGFFNSLFDFFNKSVTQKFIKSEHVDMIKSESTPSLLLKALKTYQLPKLDKWQK